MTKTTWYFPTGRRRLRMGWKWYGAFQVDRLSWNSWNARQFSTTTERKNQVHSPSYSWPCRAPLSSWITVKLVITGRRSSKLLANLGERERGGEKGGRGERWAGRGKDETKNDRKTNRRQRGGGGARGWRVGCLSPVNSTVWLAITSFHPPPWHVQEWGGWWWWGWWCVGVGGGGGAH